MSYKVTNISSDSRQFRIHKTAKGYFLRPGESVVVPYPLIINRPDVFNVVDEFIIDKKINKKEFKKDVIFEETEEV